MSLQRPARLACPPKFPFDSHLARHCRHLIGEYRQRLDHVINRVRQFARFRPLASTKQLPVSSRPLPLQSRLLRYHAPDSFRLLSHEIHAVGQVLPRAGDPFNGRLPTQFSFRTDLARHSRDFRSKGVELIHHRIYGVFHLENFTLYIDRDFLRQVASRNRRRDVCDVAHLRRSDCQPS